MRENQFKLWHPSTERAALTTPYRQEPPAAPSPSRFERVREGASALVLVARTVWADLALRRFYLRVATAQAIATLVIGLVAVSLFVDGDDEDEKPQKHKGTRSKTTIVTTDDPSKRDQSIVIKKGNHTVVIGPKGIDVRPADSNAAATPSGDASADAPQAGHATSGEDDEDNQDKADDEGKGAGEDKDDDEGKVDGTNANGEDRGKGKRKNKHKEKGNDKRAGSGPKVVVDGTMTIDDDDDDGPTSATVGRGPGAWLKAFWGKVVAIYGIFVATGWCVVALSRDYHDAIGREASLRLNLPPEDPPVSPRVRLNVDWVKTRIKRRFRGFLLFTLGAPPLWTLSFFVVLPLMGINHVWEVFDTSAVVSRLYGLLAAAWGGYWLVVFTAAKTQLAWVNEHKAPEPWFLRLWGSFTERLPSAVAWLPRGYGRAWRSMSRQVFSPADCFEHAPYEFSGLAALRLLGSVPGLYAFVRPLVPVAAALLAKRHCPLPPAPAEAPAEGVAAGPTGMRALSPFFPPR